MTGRSSKGGASWLDAWTQCLGPIGTGFPGWKVTADGAQPGGLDDLAGAYTAFADALKCLAQESENGDLAARLVAAIERIRGASAFGGGDSLLETFLAAAPMSPFMRAGAGPSAADRRFSGVVLDCQSQWLQWPAIGPYREWFDAGKALHAAATAQVKAEEKLRARYWHAIDVALQRFVEFLRDESGEPITSLKSLYDAWIDIAEAAYASEVMTAAFAADFADWINATSATRSALHVLLKRVAGVADLPNRADVEALLERQKLLSREVESMRATIEQLRRAQPAAESRDRPKSEAGPRRPSKVRKKPAGRVSKAKKPAGQGRQTARKRKPKPAAGEFDIAEILSRRD